MLEVQANKSDSWHWDVQRTPNSALPRLLPGLVCSWKMPTNGALPSGLLNLWDGDAEASDAQIALRSRSVSAFARQVVNKAVNSLDSYLSQLIAHGGQSLKVKGPCHNTLNPY